MLTQDDAAHHQDDEMQHQDDAHQDDAAVILMETALERVLGRSTNVLPLDHAILAGARWRT